MERKKSVDYSELVFIMDRSGSMSGIASDMEGAMKEVISKQKDKEGDVLVTYVRFDDEYEEVFHEKNISEIDGFSLKPRSMTALLDAIGKTVNKVERRFNQKDEADQPERILFVIVTDGGENASEEFTRPQIFEMIKKREKKGWGFIYLGSNQDSFVEGNKIGISHGRTMSYDSTELGVTTAFASASDYVKSYRTASLHKSKSLKFDDVSDEVPSVKTK